MVVSASLLFTYNFLKHIYNKNTTQWENGGIVKWTKQNIGCQIWSDHFHHCLRVQTRGAKLDTKFDGCKGPNTISFSHGRVDSHFEENRGDHTLTSGNISVNET